MTIVDINWNPSRKELKVFSLLLIVFFVIVACLARWKGTSSETAWVIVAAGTTVGVTGVFVPGFIRIVYRIWMMAVYPIGYLVSNTVLLIVFYAVVCPIGVLSRLAGRDILQLDFDKDASSYWNTRQPVKDARRYFRQY